jgi:outer membrane protein OmpA-like peptidoglycan-associated protein
LKLKSAFLLSLVALGACADLRSERGFRSASACADLTVQIYFESGSADVSPEGRGVIDSAAAIARNCRVSSIAMNAPADAAGDPEVDLQLSKRRIEAVTAVLASAGMEMAGVPVAAPSPIRRRADVVFHLTH